MSAVGAHLVLTSENLAPVLTGNILVLDNGQYHASEMDTRSSLGIGLRRSVRIAKCGRIEHIGPRRQRQLPRGVETTCLRGALVANRTTDSCTSCGLSKIDYPETFRMRVRGARRNLSSKCRPCEKTRNDRSQSVRKGRGCSSEGCPRPHARNGLCFTHANQQAIGQDLRPIRAWRRRDGRDADGNKLCSECSEWLPEASFGKTRRNADGLADYCRPCRSSQIRLRMFGITPSQYDEILAGQGGGCGICGGPNCSGRSLAIDHDHSCCPGDRSCGQCVRGLLCSNCNVGIGNFQDDPGRLLAAVAYLGRRHG